MNVPRVRFFGAFRRRRSGLLRDDRGATLIEFALLAPIFFGIVAAILETAVVFLGWQILESAVQDTGRAIRTGQAQQAGVDLDRFRTMMCGRLYGMFDCSKLHIRVTEVNDFNTATPVTPVDMECVPDEDNPCDWTMPEAYGAGIASTVVMIQVHYKFPVLLQIGPFGIADLPDGHRLMGAATVFRNEPF